MREITRLGLTTKGDHLASFQSASRASKRRSNGGYCGVFFFTRKGKAVRILKEKTVYTESEKGRERSAEAKR